MIKSIKPPSTTSYKKTAFGILPRSKAVEFEKEGVKKALEYIITLREKKPNITPSLMFAVHREGFAFLFPDWAGKYRSIVVTVGEYTPPAPHLVPELMKNLSDDLEERLKYIPSPDTQEKFLAEVISLLAWFQHRFVWIHPFQDYNGRVARLLTNVLALNLELPLFEVKAETKKDREQYIEAMKLADKHDYSKLEDLISTALKESLEKV